VEWRYLEQVMLRMSFHLEWVSSIMNCITYVIFSIIINGGYQEVIVLFLREFLSRDPLSSYLFLLCAKELITLIRKAYINVEASIEDCNLS